MLRSNLFRASNVLGRIAGACSTRLDPRPFTALHSFVPPGEPRGRILLAHRTDGMGLPEGHPRMAEHNQFQEALAIVDALVTRGWAVDAVSSDRVLPTPRGDYDLFLGLRTNFDMLSDGLDPACIRVLQIETMHWVDNNHASLGRSLEVQRSRGITPERDIEIGRNRAIEAADYAVMAGNEDVYRSFAYAGKPVFETVNPAIRIRPWNDVKDFHAARRRFLWMGSGGLAHKGLGRTLEAFAGLSDHHLTVCGPLDREPRFCEAYHRELRQTPNIRAHGWIDQTGPEFGALASATLAHVYPSCAEAQAGAVINCMAAGLIPIANRPVGIDVTPDFGVLLEDDSPRGVREAVRELASRPEAELRAMARCAWELARDRHSLEHYKTVVGDVIERILANHPNVGVSGFVRLEAPGAVAAARPAARASAG